MKPFVALILICLSFLSTSFAQTSGGYYISRTEIASDLFVKTDPFAIPITVNHDDVKAIGMGKSQIANGQSFNAMLYNPALLARGRNEFAVVSAQMSLPPGSYKAIDFLADHVSEFKSGTFVKLIKEGVREFKNAMTADGKLAAMRKIQSGLRFPTELQNAVGGTWDDPKTHGLSAIPALQAKIGNFGISLYGNAQSGFELYSGVALPGLLAINIPESAQDIGVETLLQLVAAVDPILDANGEIREDVLPEAYAMSYVDIVGVVGYAVDVNPDLSVGANIKVANRRFSTKRIAPDQFDNILKELRRDFTSSVTGVSLDLGGLYKFTRIGTEVGISLQNVIPIQIVTSSIKAKFLATNIRDYDRNGNGDPIVNQDGDTALVAEERNLNLEVPFELKTPFLVNVGARQPITRAWDVGLDVVDIAGQDDKYENALERVRLGTEYRLDAIQDQLGVAFRIGVADARPTYGLGFNIFKAIQLDAAYAYDNFIGDNSIFVQARVGW